MKIAVSGVSGFVGKAFMALAKAQGHQIIPLQRQNGVFEWGAAEGADVLLHLAGRNISARWTENFKRTMLQERREGVESLQRAVLAMAKPPKTFIIASAIGYYGATDKPATEETAAGRGFAAEVCKVLEAPLSFPKTTRVVYARLGVVLHPEGGALAKMLPAFKVGLGGPLGAGTQIISWISRTDACCALLHVAETPTLTGPVNVVTPHPLPQKDYATALGQALHRPAFLPMPAFMVKLLFGQMGEELLLQSCGVSSQKLVKSRFTFSAPTLPEALSQEGVA